MFFTCNICKEKSKKINCCKYINGVLYKFCNRCGSVKGDKGWLLYTNFLIKKVKKNIVINLEKRQKTCIKCRDIKLRNAKYFRLNKGKKPRKTNNESNYEFLNRYKIYKFINNEYTLFNEDYDKYEIFFL
jgi:hypothetical protein